MAHNPKVLKAFSAMKNLGIPKETVKLVLKKLLNLYDNNWELIEEDNYRTLADAIFECADDEQREDKKKDVMEYDGSESQPKNMLLEQEERQDSSTIDNANTVLGLEEGGIPQSLIVPKQMESSQCLKDRKTESSTHSLQLAFRGKQKDLIVTKSTSERVLSASTKDGAGFDHMLRKKRHQDCHGEDFVGSRRKQCVKDAPPVALQTSMVHSALPCILEGSSSGNGSTKYMASPFLDKDSKDDMSTCNSGTNSKNNLEIASSSSGEVTISLHYNSALGRRNFRRPNFGSVLKFLEDKYLKSFRLVGTQFSMMKLLKDLCEIYLERGADSTDRSSIRRTSSGECLPRVMETMGEASGIGNSGRDLSTKEVICLESSNSHNPAVAQLKPAGHGRKMTSRKINDITKGTEKVKISLIDEIGDERPPKFIYIPQNTVYQNAYIHFSLARIADDDCCSSCLEDCLSSSVPCECARDTGGVFAYTPQGLLNGEFLRACISMNEEPEKHHPFYCQDCPLERAKNGDRPEPCKGHLVRKFIKECWRKCGCGMQCGNRVVQRGITCMLQVFLTDGGKGWGLRTLHDLPKGAFVCEYVGEILTNMELYERNRQSSGNERHTYPVLLDADWCSEGVLKDEDALCLDATFYGNVARFINHRCFDANLLEIPVEVETPDHHYYHLAFFTKRKVDALEELTWDYGIDFSDHNHPIKAFQCCCTSEFCRDMGRKGTQSSASRQLKKG